MKKIALLLALAVTAAFLCLSGTAFAKGSGTIVGGGGGGETVNLSARHCFKDPQEGTSTWEGCGYPGEKTSGIEAAGKKCSELTPATTITSTSEGQKIEGLYVKGSINVNSKNVTIKNDCVETSGATAVEIRSGSTGTTIENTTIRGEGPRYAAGEVEGVKYKAAVEHAIFMAEAPPTSSLTLNKVYAFYCGECLLTGNGSPVTMKRSFIYTNGMQEQPSVTHFESWYTNGGGKMTIEESVLFEPVAQTADIFGDTGCSALELVVSKSFLGGGTYVLEPCSTGTSVGALKVNVSQTRFPACTGTVEAIEGGAYHICAGNPRLIEAGAIGKSNFGGTFTGGYYPQYGSTKNFRHEWGTGGITWSENFNDATGSTITESE